MDFNKLDAGLVSVCGGAARRPARFLEVFVETTDPPTDEQAALLRTAGVLAVPPGRRVFTARLTPQDLDRLSEMSWIEMITSAEQLYPAR
jgi:hypothetical protein